MKESLDVALSTRFVEALYRLGYGLDLRLCIAEIGTTDQFPRICE